MLDSDIKIVQQLEDSRLDANNKREAIIRVAFKVGDFGPFIEHMPKATYSQLERDNKLNAFAREIRAS